MAVRIGLAFNLKPAAPANPAGANSESPSSDEPPSRALRPDLHQPDLYAEWDEPATIDAVERALSTVGQVYRLEANSSFPARLALLRPDFVFNIAEGLYGPSRESHVPAICEFLGVPLSRLGPAHLRPRPAQGPGQGDSLPSRSAHRALRAGPIARRCPAGDAPLPALREAGVRGVGQGRHESKSLCRNRSQLVRQVSHLLATYAEPVVIETYLPGQEFTVAILGNGDEARCLPIIGMRFDMLPKGAPPIYGYEAKWIWDTPSNPLEIYECPADISESLAEEVRAAALAAYHALECRDWCRVDIRCDAAGRPMVVELNPLPGVLPDPRDHSCFPKAAAAAGMSYDDLIRTVADIAWRRISGRSLLAEVA